MFPFPEYVGQCYKSMLFLERVDLLWPLNPKLFTDDNMALPSLW